MKKLLQQFMKFGVVGATAFVVEYVCLILLTEYAVPAIFPNMTEGHCSLIAAPIAFCVSTIYNYIFSMRFVFEKRKDASEKKIFLIFVILSAIGLVLNEILMVIFNRFLKACFADALGGKYYLISKILATAVVTVYNFISRKMFIEEHAS